MSYMTFYNPSLMCLLPQEREQLEMVRQIYKCSNENCGREVRKVTIDLPEVSSPHDLPFF